MSPFHLLPLPLLLKKTGEPRRECAAATGGMSGSNFRIIIYNVHIHTKDTLKTGEELKCAILPLGDNKAYSILNLFLQSQSRHFICFPVNKYSNQFPQTYVYRIRCVSYRDNSLRVHLCFRQTSNCSCDMELKVLAFSDEKCPPGSLCKWRKK